MALTAAQQKALTDAEALKKKLENKLKNLEAQKAPATGQGASVAENYRLNQLAPEKPKTTAEIMKGVNEALAGLGTDYASTQAAIDELNTAVADTEEVTKSIANTTELADYNVRLTEAANQDIAAGKISAFNILKDEFDKYGLGSLVEGIRGLLVDGTPASEFALKLRETPQYQARFAANADRIKAGLAALSPAEYVAMEDQYQNIMRNYGLPKSYYDQTIDPVTGVKKQVGFEKLLAADVSAVELEDRIATAQQRVLNSNPEVLKALRQFYPDISNADILAYTLDPQNGLDNIKRKVTAAEIGGAALQQGLQAQGGTAESLAGQGITKAQAQQGYADVAQLLPRGSQLADIYGESPYNQQTAEAEVFGTAGAAEAARKRKKLTELEKASFSGSSGVGALSRDRANPYGVSQSGYGSY